MTVPKLTIPLLFAAALTASGPAQGTPAGRAQARQAVPGPSAKLEDFDKQLEPLEVKGQRFTVMLHKKRIPGGADPDTQETVARMEIRDASGRVQYEKSFPYEVAGTAFDFTTDAAAQVLQGTQGAGLLLTYGVLPSPPLGGRSWQVFGLFSGKLVPFSKPISAHGQLVFEKPDENIVDTSREPNFQPDVLEVNVWSGNFFVVVPLRIDWMMAKMSPAWRCSKMTPKGPRAICEYRVEAERIPAQDDSTFVRLFPEAEEGFTPAHVVVKKASKVEFLASAAEVVWNENADSVDLSIADDPWLKTRIDGKEGWIHTQEDFQAIGVPEAD